VVVLRVDKEKGIHTIEPKRIIALMKSLVFFFFPLGYIDLSKRRVSPEDILKCEHRYVKSKTVASILRHVASKVPSVSGSTPADGDSTAQKEGSHAADLPADKENKRAARKARQAVGHGEETTSMGVEGDREIENEEEKLEQLYEQIAWPLGKKYGHPYDAFKLALTYAFLSLSYSCVLIFQKKENQTLYFHRCPLHFHPRLFPL
jgi:hypothetical protein